jgi:hypothetical protein
MEEGDLLRWKGEVGLITRAGGGLDDRYNGQASRI